jgi:hypothetical protein
MIIIRILSGPYAGKVWEVRDNTYEGHEINPSRLLWQLVEVGSRWQIDFSNATENETVDWGRADMTLRYLRALLEGRSVFFQEVEYHADSPDQAPVVGQQIEDAIVVSGHYVTVEYDDERGVSIAVGKREHPLQ